MTAASLIFILCHLFKHSSETLKASSTVSSRSLQKDEFLNPGSPSSLSSLHRTLLLIAAGVGAGIARSGTCRGDVRRVPRAAELKDPRGKALVQMPSHSSWVSVGLGSVEGTAAAAGSGTCFALPTVASSS